MEKGLLLIEVNQRSSIKTISKQTEMSTKKQKSAHTRKSRANLRAHGKDYAQADCFRLFPGLPRNGANDSLDLMFFSCEIETLMSLFENLGTCRL